MSYYNNELYHHGVKGMKWGVRKKRDKSSFNTTHRDTGLTKSGKIGYVSGYEAPGYNKGVSKHQDRKAQRVALREGRAYRKVAGTKGNKDLSVIGNKYASEIDKYRAKNQRKTAIKNTQKNITKNSSLFEKSFYSEGTRRKAAKYVVDNNMSVAEATKKAKGEAWRNSAALIAAYGGVAIAAYASSKRYR